MYMNTKLFYKLILYLLMGMARNPPNKFVTSLQYIKKEVKMYIYIQQGILHLAFDDEYLESYILSPYNNVTSHVLLVLCRFLVRGPSLLCTEDELFL